MQSRKFDSLCVARKASPGKQNRPVASVRRLDTITLGATLGVSLACTSAFAQPTVSGSTITVPDNGWYQVQSGTDFSTLCEGIRFCTVPDGRYIVINHSSGERFENVNVSSSSGPDGITVNGSTIEWPDDGWYQVQSEDTGISVCEGGRTCTVTPGMYRIINHSTGERFTGIRVGDSGATPTEPLNPGVTVAGNTIMWQGTDWYQVQAASDFSTQCEGGSSCTVEPGIYNVINLSNGVRIENLNVGDVSTPPTSGSAPTAPPNLRGQVYSTTQIEIFWDASSDDVQVTGYRIIRNGEQLESALDARSYYQDALTPGTRYRYEVAAVDNDGNISSLSTLELITEGGTTDPLPPTADDRLVAAAQAPLVDSNNQVSWAFAPVDSGLTIIVEPYVEMPLASTGLPARWNAMATQGDRIFIMDEQDGRIYEITNREPILWFDVATAIQSTTGRRLNIDNPFHGGVRGLAFHPDFSVNGKFYTTLMEQRPADTTQHRYLSDAALLEADSVLVEWTADPSTLIVNPASYREVFRVGIPEFDHPIKQIAFDPSAGPGDREYGLLYIAHGDGSRESTTTVGGQGNNALGKILRINPLANGTSRYSVPGDNPFLGNTSMLDEVFSIGHRNPHHLAFTQNGTLIATEDGRDNIDEINLIRAGADYGWSQREGAYTQLSQPGLFTGVGTLPADDASLGLTYPVAQFGHTGELGASFTGQALGGGFAVENGSALSGQFFYIDFPKSGEVFHSSIDAMLSANTQGVPDSLTVARTGRAGVAYDHDNNPATDVLQRSLKDIVRSATGYVNTNDRVDVRYGQGPEGELYLMSKRNNMVYLISNSLPSSGLIPGEIDVSGFGKPTGNTGTHGFDVWDLMSAEAQAVTPSDCLLSASPLTAPFYCFSPRDRRLMRIEGGGSVAWQFSLPGENSSNRIEAVNFVNGSQLAVTVDATPSPDDSAFDTNLFEQTGAYIGTVHIIPDIANPDGTDFAGVNLDGTDLIVHSGPIRTDGALFTSDLYIYAEHYSEIPGGDPTLLSGWRKEGAFRARLDSRTGETFDILLFPGISASQALARCAVPTSASAPANGC